MVIVLNAMKVINNFVIAGLTRNPINGIEYVLMPKYAAR